MGEGGIATLAKPVGPPKLVLPPRNPSEAFIRGGLNSATPTPMTFLSNFLAEQQDPYMGAFSPLLAGSLTLPCPASMSGESINKEEILDLAACGDLTENPQGSTPADVTGEMSVQPTCARYKARMPSKIPISCSSRQLTILPGLSPASLLESPILFSMGQVDPSPTTGHAILLAPFERGRELCTSLGESCDGSPGKSDSFNFRPFSTVAKSEPFTSSDMGTHSTHGNAVVKPELECERSNIADTTVNDSRLWLTSEMTLDAGEHESYLELMQTKRPWETPATSHVLAEVPHHLSQQFSVNDGYRWKKYGQKQLKNSENPRSYYKCTFPNCPIKKRVERSEEGEITEIIYKGEHNHPKPENTRRGATTSQVSSAERLDRGAPYFDSDRASCDLSSSFGLGHGWPPGTPELSFNSPTNGAEGDDAEANGMKDDEEEELDSKRRRIEDENQSLASGPIRTVREPRVIVRTVSQVDILDDGYRWRKYGQKVVKGHLHPRNYYKCTNIGCFVRKHVERSSTNPKSVMTTYTGKHNHSVPPARGSAATIHLLSPADEEHVGMSHEM